MSTIFPKFISPDRQHWVRIVFCPYEIEWVINQVSSIGKGKFDGLMKELKKSLSESKFIRLEAQVQDLIELDYQPRLQTTAIRKG